ncbi:MAG: site-specific DNA-methyltransferase [Rhizobiaceae bacterium]|nr:site-specific DNA-methyltransferase [Rhizobiaceae bacterium]
MAGEMFVAAWCGPGHAKKNAGGKRGVYTFCTNNSQRDGRYPTEKPVDLMRALVRDFSGPDDLILDPFMGSGTNGVASLLEGRIFAGFKKMQNHFDVATQRFECTVTQAGPVVRRAQKQSTYAGDHGPLFEGGDVSWCVHTYL